MAEKKRRILTRRKFLGSAVTACLGAGAYAHWIEPKRLQVTEKEILIPNLPDGLQGLKIAQLTDFHFQPDTDTEKMAEIVATANSLGPDIIALTGDYVNHDPKVFFPLMEILASLEAKHGVYGITGNHDGWASMPKFYQQGFTEVGFDYLINDGTSIIINNEKLYIIGTDSVWSGQLDFAKCYKGHRGETVLALVHEPDVFDDITSAHPVHLQLSGHTHGGQCRVPFIGYAPVKVKYGRNYLYGNYQSGNSQLFVSQGLGTVGLRVRFACIPEIALLTLSRK